nr:DUF3530 family protein [Aliamphritea spongicola]
MAPIVLSEHLNTTRKQPVQTTDNPSNRRWPTGLRKLICATLFPYCALASFTALAEENNDSAGMTEMSDTMQTDGMSDTPTSSAPRSIPNPAAQRAAALAQEQSPETEIIWLETDKETQLGLFMPSGITESYGGIILFHGSMATPDWPDIIRPLRLSLSDQGWATLSVALPDPNPAPVPERNMQPSAPSNSGDGTDTDPAADAELTDATETEASEAAMTESAMQDETMANSMAKEESTPKEPYIDQLTRIAIAASTQLTDREQNRQIIIGVGTGAVWAAAYIAYAQDDQNIRLLMIDPRQPEDPEAPQLSELIPLLDSETVLDLYFENSELSKAQARQRLRLSKRSKLPDYRQIKINQRPDDSKREQQWLAKKVRGILKTNIIDADFARTTEGRLEAEKAMQLMPGG